MCLSFIVRTNPPIFNLVFGYTIWRPLGRIQIIYIGYLYVSILFLLDNNFYHISVIDIQRDDAQRLWII